MAMGDVMTLGGRALARLRLGDAVVYEGGGIRKFWVYYQPTGTTEWLDPAQAPGEITRLRFIVEFGEDVTEVGWDACPEMNGEVFNISTFADVRGGTPTTTHDGAIQDTGWTKAPYSITLDPRVKTIMFGIRRDTRNGAIYPFDYAGMIDVFKKYAYVK